MKIDETEVKEDGLHVEGVLEVSLLYLTADDSQPIQSSVEVIPFHYLIEAPGINEKTICQLVPGLEQMSAVMMGGGTVFALDHRIPNGVPIENYRYYVQLGREMLGLEPAQLSEHVRMAF